MLPGVICTLRYIYIMDTEARTPKKDIIRAASYHRRDYDLSVIRINPHDHEVLHSRALNVAWTT